MAKIDLGFKLVEVDGVEYKLGTLSAMGVFYGASWAMRTMGGPIAKALSTSDGLGDFIKKVSDKDIVEQIGDLSTDNPLGFFAQLGALVDISALVEIVGDAVRIAGERMTGSEIRDWVTWAVVDLLWVPREGGMVPVESTSDFDAYLGDHIRKHGPLHVLKLFWAIMRAHVGPTSAGIPG